VVDNLWISFSPLLLDPSKAGCGGLMVQEVSIDLAIQMRQKSYPPLIHHLSTKLSTTLAVNQSQKLYN